MRDFLQIVSQNAIEFITRVPLFINLHGGGAGGSGGGARTDKLGIKNYLNAINIKLKLKTPVNNLIKYLP